MSPRLLHRTFGGGSYDSPRAALAERRISSIVHAGALTLRVGALPLHRRIDGASRQVVRVEAADPSAATTVVPVRIALHTGTTEHDAGTLEPGTARHLDLWVPATAEPETYEVQVEGTARGSVRVAPQRRWTIHLVHHSHLDLGYTDPQDTVLRNQLEYLDAALALATATDDRPDDARFRWTVESALPAVRWLQVRPSAQVDELLRRVRDERIELTAMPYQLHTEAASDEELRRVMRHAVRLRDQHGVRIDSAVQTDVPGAVVGMIDVLAESGVRYLAAAHNWAGRSVPYRTGGVDLSRPFWWRSPSGRRLLVWFTDSAHGMAYMEGNIVGLAEGFAQAARHLPAYLDGLANRATPYGSEVFGWTAPMPEAEERSPYPYDVLHLRVQGGPADNASPSVVPSDVVREWNATYEWPRLRLSTNRDFFVQMEAQHGDALPELTGDWTDWWADGIGSAARPLGWTRRAQSVLRTAETVHALADARSGGRTGPEEVDAAYDELALFDEHTWGAANPWADDAAGFGAGATQWAWKQAHALRGAARADDLLHAGVRRLGATFDDDGTCAVVVLNTWSGERTELAEVFVPASVVDLATDVQVLDGRTGEKVGAEVVVQDPRRTPTRPQGRWVRFLAERVPGLGFARFHVVPGGIEEPAPIDQHAEEVVLTGAAFEVTVDTRHGTIARMVHRGSGRDLVAPTALAGMNEYLYSRYATAPHVNHLSGHLAAHSTELLADRTASGPAIVHAAERTALVDRIVLDRRPDGVDWLRTTIEVPHHVDRVHVSNRLMKRETATKESIHFAFPFATRGRALWELTGGVGGQDVAKVPGSAEHMEIIRHWVAFEEDEPGLAIAWASLQAPLVHLGDIPVPYAPYPTSLGLGQPERGTVYSWALNNLWDTNFPPAQGGEMTFDYAISAAADASARALGARTAAGLTDGLVAFLAPGAHVPAGPGDAGATQPASGTLLELDDDHVLVTSIGRAGDGGIVVRLRSIAAEERTVRLRLGVLDTSTVRIGDGMEGAQVPTTVHDGVVEVAVAPQAHVTVVVDEPGAGR